MPKPVRLSESHLWTELRAFYEDEGVTVWTSDRVPFFATNNPALAKTYSDLFVAYLEDCSAAGLLDSKKPVYIVELGGGMGRLAYLMLVRLKEIASLLPCEVRYLLTDYSQSNVDHYRSQETFAPYFENGSLEIQQLDAEKDLLALESPNPIFAIANYLFDSLSQDGFRVHNGVLSETKGTLDQEGKLVLTHCPVEPPIYGIEPYDELLESYRVELGNTHVPFPIGPLRCLDRLSRASQGRLALVMADKAMRTKEELLDFTSLPFQKHERGFSMSVNCHAIDWVWEKSGGLSLHSTPRDNPLHLALYCKGLKESQIARTRHVFLDQVDGFGPLDYLDFRAQFLSLSAEANLKLCIQLLRLSRWDPELFCEMGNRIGEASLTASLEEKRELYAVMTKCWANFFPIKDDRDVPFAVARVLACINQFQQAIGFYGESLRLYGAKALTHHNIGICHFNLGQHQEASLAFKAALALDRDYGPSKELLLRTEAERERLEKLKP